MLLVTLVLISLATTASDQSRVPPWAETPVRDGFAIYGGELPTDPNEDFNGVGGFYVMGCTRRDFSDPDFSTVPPATDSDCNNLEMPNPQVIVRSKVTSCLDIYRHGVVEGFFIKEVANRKWESFRISCRKLKRDGTLGGKRVKAPFLFNYESKGKLHSTVIPPHRLPVGMFELENTLQLKQSLLSIGLLHQSAQEVREGNLAGTGPRAVKTTERVPPAAPLSMRTRLWACPHSMVLTGAAIGHVPDEKGRHSRPVYLLAECRKLFFNE